MDTNRKLWNEQHKRLRQALDNPDDHATAIDLFLRQHAMVHDAEMSKLGLYSFADEVWQGEDEVILRCVPPKFEHSIIWLIWHIARIEDMTMNALMAGRPQIFFQDDWLKKLNWLILPGRDADHPGDGHGLAEGCHRDHLAPSALNPPNTML